MRVFFLVHLLGRSLDHRNSLFLDSFLPAVHATEARFLRGSHGLSLGTRHVLRRFPASVARVRKHESAPLHDLRCRHELASWRRTILFARGGWLHESDNYVPQD